MKKVFILIFLLPLLIEAQQNDSIDIFTCYNKAIQEFAIAKNMDLSTKIGEAKAASVSTAKLPKFNAVAQASYQSDVIALDAVFSSFPPNIPTPDIEALPKDQYKLYVEAQQLIYNGGLIDQLKTLEYENAKVEAKKIEIQLQDIYSNVNDIYFSILLMQKQQNVLSLLKQDIEKRLDILEVAYKNGTSESSNIEKLKSEKLLLDQQEVELKYNKQALLFSLSQLTGDDCSNKTLILPDSVLYDPEITNRPEFELYSLEENRLGINSKIIQKQKYPVVGGFGQFGFGKPALDILNPNFDNYYLVGINIKWNIWDWGKSKKDQEMLSISKNMIGNLRESFADNLEIQKGVQQHEIMKLSELIESDIQIINLKNEIMKSVNNQLDNGTITSTEYLVQLNEKKKAEINKAIHEIKYSQAKMNLLTLLGQNHNIK